MIGYVERENALYRTESFTFFESTPASAPVAAAIATIIRAACYPRVSCKQRHVHCIVGESGGNVPLTIFVRLILVIAEQRIFAHGWHCVGRVREVMALR